MKNWKKMILTAAAFGSLALFAGCTTASAVSLEEAKEIVQQTVGAPNAVVIEQETDRDDGVYELEIIIDGVGYEFEVDSRTGEVREIDRDDDLPAAVQTPPTETTPAATEPAQTAPAATQPQRITLDEAKAIAYTHAGVSESDAYDKSWEDDDGMYEIDFEYDGWDYEYDISYDGTILKSEKEPDNDSRRTSAQPAATEPAQTTEPVQATEPVQTQRITGQEALSIAMTHAGVTDARDRDVEWDDGRWEVSFESGRTEYEYDIAADGSILRWEKEND